MFAQAERSGGASLTPARYRRVTAALASVWTEVADDAYDEWPAMLHFEQVISRRSIELYVPAELVVLLFDALCDARA